jgi:hypothetical protein
MKLGDAPKAEGRARHLYERLAAEIDELPFAAQMSLLRAFQARSAWEHLPEQVKDAFRNVAPK